MNILYCNYDYYSQGEACPQCGRCQASVYIRAPDQMTSIHAFRGTSVGNALTMHACPTSSDLPNCQWQIVASTTRTGMYYIKASDKETYIHARRGTSAGKYNTDGNVLHQGV